MTDATELDERLARLAARRASASSAPDAGTRVAPERPKRRRHAAAAGRVFAAGLSTSGFLAIVTALAAQQPASGATKVATAPPRGSTTLSLDSTSMPPTTKSKVVVKTVHHTVFVDKYGRPIAPPVVPATVASSGGRSSSATHYVSTPSAHPAVGQLTPPPPSSGPAPTKAPTTSPSTPHTSPPVTVQTPPPPPPPHCTGSKCP